MTIVFINNYLFNIVSYAENIFINFGMQLYKCNPH